MISKFFVRKLQARFYGSPQKVRDNSGGRISKHVSMVICIILKSETRKNSSNSTYGRVLLTITNTPKAVTDIQRQHLGRALFLEFRDHSSSLSLGHTKPLHLAEGNRMIQSERENTWLNTNLSLFLHFSLHIRNISRSLQRLHP